jgi:membrane protein insertase Oxa1/YidC/SpoIIIJ
MTYEGALWFPDLTVPDPWFGLPVMCALTTLAMIRSPSFAASMGSGGQSDVMRKVMLAVSLMFIPAGYYASSAIALLWTINSAVGIAQNAVFANPKVRAALELPPTKGASASSASGSASSGDSVQSLLQRVLGDSAQQPAAATAAAGAGGGRPPPPGTKKAGAAAAPAAPAGIRPGSLAVNYTSARPKRRRS